MALCPDDKQVGVKTGGKRDDVTGRAARHDMGMKRHLAFFRHCARPLDYIMKSMGLRFCRLARFSSKFPGQIGDFLDANHVEIGLILFGDCER